MLSIHMNIYIVRERVYIQYILYQYIKWLTKDLIKSIENLIIVLYHCVQDICFYFETLPAHSSHSVVHHLPINNARC